MRKVFVSLIFLIVCSGFLYAQFDKKGIKELEKIEGQTFKVLNKVEKNTSKIEDEVEGLSDTDLYQYTVNTYNAYMEDYILAKKMAVYYAKKTLKIIKRGKFKKMTYPIIRREILRVAKNRIGSRLPLKYFDLVDVPYIWKMKVLSSKDDLFDEQLQFPRKMYKVEIQEVVKGNNQNSIGDIVEISHIYVISPIKILEVGKEYLTFVGISSNEENVRFSEFILKFIDCRHLPEFKNDDTIDFLENTLGYSGEYNWEVIKNELVQKYGGGIK